MDHAASSAYSWALHELGSTHFNDKRLTNRAVKITAMILQHSRRSIPASCGSWSNTKATYRFFANNKVHSQNMLSTHVSKTVNRCATSRIVLVAHETTAMQPSSKQITGLEEVGAKNFRGFFTHSALALTTAGVPLGLMYQKMYVQKENKKRDYIEKSTFLPIDPKGSARWIETMDSVSEKLTGKRVVLIGDREADTYDIFKTAKEKGIDLLIRTSWNRKVPSREEQRYYQNLFDQAQQGKIIATDRIQVPTKEKCKTRKATVTIRIHSFMLIAPIEEKTKGIPLYILDVSEENPPRDVEPIHWMLTTNMKITTAEQAIEKVQWYLYRWRIAQFHCILKKSAFNVEKLQFDTFSRFKKAITIYSIVAWRILWTMYQVKESPHADARTIFSKEEIQALCYTEKMRRDTMTVQEAIKALASLGGHLERGPDELPGVKTLCIGFQALHLILRGVSMAKYICPG